MSPVPHPSPASPPFGLRWFWPELRRHRAIWRHVLLSSLCLQVLGLLTPLLTQAIIDKVLVHRTHQTLIAIGVALVGGLVFTALLGWARQSLLLHASTRIDAALSQAVFEHLLALPLSHFRTHPVGAIMARLHGVETVRQWLTGSTLTLLLDLPFLLILLTLMGTYSGPLTAAVVGVLALLTLLSVAATPVLRQRLQAQFGALTRLQAFLTEHLAAMATVKALQMEGPLHARHLALREQQRHTTQLAGQWHTLLGTMAQTLESAQHVLVLLIGAWLCMTRPEFTVGMLVAFQMLAHRLSQPLMRLVGLYQESQQAMLALRRLADLMNLPTEHTPALCDLSPSGPGHLTLVDLSFRHHPDAPWLFRHLHAQLPARLTTVVCGASGCGKSTLADLLQGLLPPTDGRILLDQQAIHHLGTSALRRCLGVVPQDTTLFAGTLAHNLQLACPQASTRDMQTACEQAGLWSFIRTLPMGLNAPVGEGGIGLSGGQRQRLAIARALLRQPRVLIFDEATAHLDAAQAQDIAHTINALRGHITVVFITHHLPPALIVDQLLSLSPMVAPPGRSGAQAPLTRAVA